MNKPQLSLQEIQKLHQDGHLEEAKQGYLSLLHTHTEQAAVLHSLGLLYAEEGDLTQAEECMRRAVEIEPHNPTQFLHLANVLKAKGELTQAKNILLTLTQSHPQFAAAFNNLGIVYFAQQDWQQAVSAYQSAIALQTNYVDAYYNLGLALGKLGRRREAMNAYQAVLELSPLHPGAHFQSGLLLMQMNQYETAVSHFSQLEKDYPFHFETQTNLASCYLHLGRLLEAKTHYLKAAELVPTDNQVIFNLAVLHVQQGWVDEGVKYYLQAVKNDPDFYDAHHNLGFIYLVKRDIPAALRHFEQALRLQPNNEATRHTIRILKGDKTLSGSPPEYIRSLFDSYADHFESHLLQGLHYQVPHIFYQIMQTWQGGRRKHWDVLDIGCGTGLCGQLFKPMARSLVGVDMSEKMLAEAAKKNIYDALFQADMLTFLADKKKQYDFIMAGDVLVYFGDLKAVFPAIHQALLPEGVFLFDVEVGDENDYHLTDSGRFAHSKSYIDDLLAENNFRVLHYQTAVIRTQNERAVMGHLYLVQKQLVQKQL